MRASALSTVRQALLLCALAIGLVGMHHLTSTDDMPAAPAAMSVVAAPTSADPHAAPCAASHCPADHAPDSAHTLMHLCLAVLCAAGAALTGLWMLLRALAPHARSGAPIASRASPARDRPPDRRGRVLLLSVCVLRL